VRSAPCTWRQRARVYWLSLKTKVDGLLVVWPQNHWDDFSSVCASKLMVAIYEWFDLKTTQMIFAGLASKPMVMVSSGLASKPAATVFWRFGIKTCCDGFLQFGIKTGGDSFSRFDLKIGGWFLG
jgi:hypothetical protein